MARCQVNGLIPGFVLRGILGCVGIPNNRQRRLLRRMLGSIARGQFPSLVVGVAETGKPLARTGPPLQGKANSLPVQ
jgi:hypothetical protein